jgi:acyl-[acyl-carrier-protein] desaturase
MNLFVHFASVAQRIGVYTARDYTDIVKFFVKQRKVETLEGGLCGLAPRMWRATERATDMSKKDEPKKVKFSWIYDRKVVL